MTRFTGQLPIMTLPHVFWHKGIVNTLTFLGVCLPLVIGAILACRDLND